MKTPALATLAALVLAAGAWAGGTLELRAQTPTRIYLDGEFLGETPLVLSNMQPGDYQVQAEDPATGELRTFAFHSPARVNVSKVLDVSPRVAPLPVPAPAPPPQPVVRQVTYTTPAPVVCPPVRRVVYTQPTYTQPRYWSSGSAVAPVRARPSQRARAKNHTRNALLGLTAASQVFTGDRRDRKRYRNVGLGLTLLNEILR